jgi:hypothetical protein
MCIHSYRFHEVAARSTSLETVCLCFNAFASPCNHPTLRQTHFIRSANIWVLKELTAQNQTELLQFFESHRRRQAKTYSIWQDIQAKNIITREFLAEKVEYIHNNPINKDWHLTNHRADYIYSSACFYDDDRKPIIDVDDVREWL